MRQLTWRAVEPGAEAKPGPRPWQHPPASVRQSPLPTPLPGARYTPWPGPSWGVEVAGPRHCPRPRAGCCLSPISAGLAGLTKPQAQIRAQLNLFCSQAGRGAGPQGGGKWGEAAGSAPALLSAALPH